MQIKTNAVSSAYTAAPALTTSHIRRRSRRLSSTEPNTKIPEEVSDRNRPTYGGSNE